MGSDRRGAPEHLCSCCFPGPGQGTPEQLEENQQGKRSQNPRTMRGEPTPGRGPGTPEPGEENQEGEGVPKPQDNDRRTSREKGSQNPRTMREPE